jgi:hypothetical protein
VLNRPEKLWVQPVNPGLPLIGDLNYSLSVVIIPGVIIPGVIIPGVMIPGVIIPGVIIPGVIIPVVIIPGVFLCQSFEEFLSQPQSLVRSALFGRSSSLP